MTARWRRPAEAGFTLVELLVAMLLGSVLITVAMATVVGSQEAVVVSKQQQDLNAEARQALNRMSRDVRQANAIVQAVKPNGFSGGPADGVVAVQFTADFDGDGCIASTTSAVTGCNGHNDSNPEDITYCFEPTASKLFLIDNAVAAPMTATECTGLPLLAGNVSDFSVEYRSNLYRHDANQDGVTSWLEVDQSAAGNNNSVLDVEVDSIDSLVLNITMRLDGREQVYRTQVDLRNRST